MGKLTERIDSASPTRLVEIAEDLLKVKCEFCEKEKEDVKDARMSLRDYIQSIRSQLKVFGVLGGAGGTVYGWKALLKKISSMGFKGMIAVSIVGLLAIWWLYEIWEDITLRVRELREALHKLDNCLEKHNCH